MPVALLSVIPNACSIHQVWLVAAAAKMLLTLPLVKQGNRIAERKHRNLIKER